MPRKRIKSKRRADTTDVHNWATAFLAGWDFFDDLADAGIDVDEHGRPSRTAMEAAWRQFGDAFLVEYADRDVTPWAHTEFGEP